MGHAGFMVGGEAFALRSPHVICHLVEFANRRIIKGCTAKTVLGPGDQAAPLAFPDAIVSVGDLLRR